MLSEQEKHQIATRVTAFEATTGVQLVTTLLPRSDDYPELPWKAFALGIAAGVGLVLLAVGVCPLAGGTALAIVLGTGLVSAALAFFVPAFARWFLSTARAEGETRQAAQALFLEHELFQTRDRTGVLMLVSTFEHRVVLLADRALRARLPATALDEVVAAMTASLRSGADGAAFAAGIDRLEALVRAHGFKGGSGDDNLPNHLDATGKERD